MLASYFLRNNMFTPKWVRSQLVSYYQDANKDNPRWLYLFLKPQTTQKISLLIQWGMKMDFSNPIHCAVLDYLFKSKDTPLNLLTTIFENGSNIGDTVNLRNDIFRSYLLHEYQPSQSNIYHKAIFNLLIENRSVYKDFIYNESIKSSHKLTAETYLLSHHIDKVLSHNTAMLHNNHGSYQDSWEVIEEILVREIVFSEQQSTFHTLYIFFKYSNRLWDELRNKYRHLLCEKFNSLSITARKSLIGLLQKQYNHIHTELLFNLLSHGLDLNWNLPDGNAKNNNILAFSLLYNIENMNVILSSESFNITVVNNKHENILHNIGTMGYANKELQQKLTKKIQSLNDLQRYTLLNQQDNEGNTPLMKALQVRDEIMVDYLIDYWKISPLAIIPNASHNKQSALLYLDEYLLKSCSEVDPFYENKVFYWQQLSKKWNTEKIYHELQITLPQHQVKKRQLKI